MANLFSNTDLFHFRHLFIVSICIIFIIYVTSYALKKWDVNKVHKYLMYIGIISESLKVLTYIVLNEETLGGYLPKSDLPFHLCSIQLIFIGILNFSKNEKLKHALHSFMVPTCLIGGIFALILATSSSRTNPVIMVQYFLYHSSIIAFAIYLLLNKKIKFTVTDYKNSLLILLGFFFIAIYMNSILYYQLPDGTFANINFMYVVSPPIDGLPFLNKNEGWLVYIIRYAILAITLVTLVYIKPIYKSIKKHKQN